MIKYFQELIDIIENEAFTEEKKAELIHAISKDEAGTTILHFAIQYQNLPIIQHLLQKVKVDPDIDDYNDTPLTLAIRLNNIEIIKELLRAKADPNKDISPDLTPLIRTIQAIRKNSFAIVKLLVKNGANPNMSTSFGNIPIIETVLISRKEVERFLVYNLKNIGNYPSYIYKSQLETKLKNCPEILEFFTDKGVEIEAIDNYISENLDVFNALVDDHLKNHLNILEFLLQSGAKINSTDRECGCTALHIAAGEGNLDAVKLLVKHGADINIINAAGCTPLYLSLENGQQEIAALLIQNTLLHNYKADKPYYLNREHSIYWNKCYDEIEKMQQHKIGDSEISLFDILVADKKKLASYLNHYDVVEVLDAYDCEKKFPIYADKIKNQYTKGMNRKVAADIVLNLSIALNEYTSRMIFDRLDYPKIRSLCIAGHQEFTKNKQAEEFREQQHTNTEAAPERLVEDDDAVNGCFSCIRVKKHGKSRHAAKQVVLEVTQK